MKNTKSVGENSLRMVTNAELAKKVEDQEEENRLLGDRLLQLERKLDVAEDKT